MRRLRVLMSAYACEPGKGSEPGIGWHMAKAVAAHHDLWVLTRANNRPAIDAALAETPVPGLTFVYLDLPAWASWWKRGNRNVRLYYYLWQILAYTKARPLHAQIKFDLVHHATFGLYLAPSFVALLSAPFLWGPVGGGEGAPASFTEDLAAQGQRHERLRRLFQRLALYDPFVRLTARRSAVTLATTIETLEKLQDLNLKESAVTGNCALSVSEIEGLAELAARAAPQRAKVLISIGRLIHWKAYHLAIRAFAALETHAEREAEYWIIGDGAERTRLERLAAELGVEKRVRFLGKLSRAETLEKLAHSDVFVHPSLHDSGGWATLEAMACAKPVLCLNLGGPGSQITPQTGVKLEARNPEQVVAELSSAMANLLSDNALREDLGAAGQRRVREHYSWPQKGLELARWYERAAQPEGAVILEANA